MTRGWVVGIAGAACALAAVTVVGACVDDATAPAVIINNSDEGGGGGGDASPSTVDGSSPSVDAAVDSGCGDTQTNAMNCGTCGHACNAGDSCYHGICGGNRITQVSAGNNHACGLTKAGTVLCWGTNNNGQIGVSSAMDMSCVGATPCRPPVEVPGLTGVKQVAAGNGSTCAVKTDGTVLCWGSNGDGELGHDPATDGKCMGAPCNSTPTLVAGLSAIAGVAVGGGNACAWSMTGAAYCWGQGVWGVLGNGVVGATSPTPVGVSTLSSGVTQVSIENGGTVACAAVNGTASCWGENNIDELGHSESSMGDIGPSCVDGGGTYPCNPTPTTVSGATSVNAVAAAGGTAFALRGGGTVVSWGWDQYGLRGAGPGVIGTSPTPTVVPVIPSATSISARQFSACSLGAAGAVWCWGVNSVGQLGDGTTTGADDGGQCAEGFPCKPPVLVPSVTATQISVGAGFVLALASDGSVWSWGANKNYQLGHAPGTAGDQTACSCNPTPTKVVGLP
jgi:alpha-tubulin suppressor-like RCC1 family protein